ncbi:MAG: ribosome-associated translation inhibitor RaiA [Candidatus Microsaccharimonas sp.]
MIASIDITGIKYNVNERTLKYVTEKVGKLDKYIPSHARKTVTADVKLRQVNRDHGNKYEAEVILHVPEKVIMAKDSTLNMMAAIDIVEAKLVAQLRKYKEAVLDRKVAAKASYDLTV